MHGNKKAIPRIKKLASDVIELIAAGEVAERPASIIKELIENSIDAHATLITIHLENAGVDKIIVTDNGVGITAEDLPISVMRHTTSKISAAEDLYHLHTLGFRGEALASIAQVSHLTLKSRTSTTEHGYQLEATNETTSEVAPVGMPVGTTVIVDALFSNLPARKKFLKTPQSELRQIIDIVTATALANPEISFSVTNDAKPIIKIAANQQWVERVASLLGIHDTTLLIPFSVSHEAFQVSGFLANPQFARRTTKQQFIFVNKRPVAHPPFSKAIKTAYGTLLDAHSHPSFVLDVIIDPEQVDVNVHPRKETVLFKTEVEILTQLQTTLKAALASHDLTYRISSSAYQIKDSGSSYDASQFSETKKSLGNQREIWKPGKLETEDTILQVHNTYLITEMDQQIVLIDQHAAHERILYEEFTSQIQEQLSPLQHALPKPVLLELTVSDFLLIQEQFDSLKNLGFELELFGQTTIKVSAVPISLKRLNISKLLREVVDDLRENNQVSVTNHKVTAYLACRSAIKAGDFLTPDQRLSLINKLQEVPNKSTCPHGRPTMITISRRELESLFKRKV